MKPHQMLHIKLDGVNACPVARGRGFIEEMEGVNEGEVGHCVVLSREEIPSVFTRSGRDSKPYILH
jgi:hypothetical protein